MKICTNPTKRFNTWRNWSTVDLISGRQAITEYK